MNRPLDSTSVGVTLGDGLALVSDLTLALVDTENGELAERLWELISCGSGVDDVLEELSATGLRSLGSFALAQLEDDGIRVVVRGEARAWLTRPDLGTSEYDAGAVRTWFEHVEPGADGVVLSLRGDDLAPTPYRASAALLPAVGLRWPGGAHGSGELTGLDASDVADGLLELDRSSTTDQHPGSHTVVAAVTDLPSGPEQALDSELDESAAGIVTPASAAEAPVSHDTVPDSRETIHLSRYVRDEEAQDEKDAPEPDHAAPPHDDNGQYDDLWGHTVHRSVQDAAVESIEDEAAAPQISGVPTGRSLLPADELGDHDGLTITAAQLKALRDPEGDTSNRSPAGGPMGGPTVQAVICPVGHHNPPHLTTCRVCGRPIHGTPVTIARPPLGTIRFSTGDVVELDRPAILGRNPRIEGQFPNELPQTVVIDAGNAVSRSHLLVRLEGWQVWVEDLGSANGTTITLPGEPPQRLRSGEPFLLEPGARVDLGDEVDGTYETS